MKYSVEYEKYGKKQYLKSKYIIIIYSLLYTLFALLSMENLRNRRRYTKKPPQSASLAEISAPCGGGEKKILFLDLKRRV